jgi:prepilin-type N-terminal cleavage/methylation domain-containing protein
MFGIIFGIGYLHAYVGYDENGALIMFHSTMNTENRMRRRRTMSIRGNQEAGFTFIELIMVIVLIGIMTSIAAQKMMSAAQQAEITAESMTVDVMRANLINNYGNDLLNGVSAQFSLDPFTNLSKVPEGYNRLKNSKPTGEKEDAETWVFVTGGGASLTAQDAGTTLTNFLTSGFIYHQRKDGTVVKWPYDSANGIIGKKQIDVASQVNIQSDLAKQQRGEPTEKERLRKTQ